MKTEESKGELATANAREEWRFLLVMGLGLGVVATTALGVLLLGFRPLSIAPTSDASTVGFFVGLLVLGVAVTADGLRMGRPWEGRA